MHSLKRGKLSPTSGLIFAAPSDPPHKCTRRAGGVALERGLLARLITRQGRLDRGVVPRGSSSPLSEIQWREFGHSNGPLPAHQDFLN